MTTTTAPSPLACVRRLPLRVRVGQLVTVGIDTTPADESSAYARLGVGGGLLTTESGVSASSVAAFRDAGRIPLLVAVDEEGGNVQRLAGLTGAVPSQQTVAATMSADAAQALIARHARRVAALGVSVVFAPVVDVAPPSGTAPIGTRSFGSDPAKVTAYAHSYIDGWRSAGVLPVVKHFPGFGSASANTDDAPAVVPPLDQLRQRDLVPYDRLARDANGIAVMVGHMRVPGFTNDAASLYPQTYELLRADIGFAGLVFTDALDAGAITVRRSVPAAAVAAVAAGADDVLVMHISEAPAVVAGLIAAVGRGAISTNRVDAAVLRILAAKRVDPCGVR